MPGQRLTPTQAGAIAKRARRLLRRGLLTHCQLALLDCLLWSCRRPDTGAIVVSYTRLQQLARVARATVAAGLRRLEELGLLSRVRRRVRVLWANGGQQSRQGTSAYMLHAPDPHSEFSARTVIGGQETLIREHHDNAALRIAQEALTRRREAFTRGLLMRG
jgi:hypothetical protein